MSLEWFNDFFFKYRDISSYKDCNTGLLISKKSIFLGERIAEIAGSVLKSLLFERQRLYNCIY